MAGHAIICAVIREREDDSTSDKYLVVAPEDRIVWVANTGTETHTDLLGEGRNRAVTKAKLMSLIAKFEREEKQHDNEGDIMDISDEQLECRGRNSGRCERFPHLTKTQCEKPKDLIDEASESSADGLDDTDECSPGVLECWMLEEEVD